MLERIRRKLAGRSLREIADAAGKTAMHAVRSLSPAARNARAHDAAFDQKWGTDTSTKVPVWALEFPDSLAQQAVRYQPSGPDTVDELLLAVEFEAAEFAFVDLGSGKGRMVLSAAAVPFRRAIGVEYSEQLDSIARRNAEIFVSKGGAKIEPEFRICDAGEYDPPAGSLFVYLYNPFGPKILNACLDRLEAAMRRERRRILLAYTNPEHAGIVRNRPQWLAIFEEDDVVIFELDKARFG